MKESLPVRAAIDQSLPDKAVRYRTLFIVPKRDFGANGFLIKGKIVKSGWIVTDGNCNVMPGATWFRTKQKAKFAIDVLIAVEGDADMFWEIIQPFKHTPGEKSGDSAGANSTTTQGRHYAKYEGGTCVEVGVLENPPKY